jgi:hypothetical protein
MSTQIPLKVSQKQVSFEQNSLEGAQIGYPDVFFCKFLRELRKVFAANSLGAEFSSEQA